MTTRCTSPVPGASGTSRSRRCARRKAGAWQTAVRIRVAHSEALRHRPEGTAFDVRPTPEDGAPLNLALDTLRAQRARASEWSARRLTSPERNREPTNPERPHARLLLVQTSDVVLSRPAAHRGTRVATDAGLRCPMGRKPLPRQKQGAGPAGILGNRRGRRVALPALALAQMRAPECRAVARPLRTRSSGLRARRLAPGSLLLLWKSSGEFESAASHASYGGTGRPEHLDQWPA